MNEINPTIAGQPAAKAHDIETIIDRKIKALRSALREQNEKTKRMIAWIKRNKAAIADIGIVPTCVVGYFDFDNPNREQILKIIKAFPGDWEKEQNNTGATPRMNYTRAKTDTEPPLRIWSGELPPSCRIIQEPVFVPQHTEMRARIVCGGGKEIAP